MGSGSLTVTKASARHVWNVSLASHLSQIVTDFRDLTDQCASTKCVASLFPAFMMSYVIQPCVETHPSSFDSHRNILEQFGRGQCGPSSMLEASLNSMDRFIYNT